MVTLVDIFLAVRIATEADRESKRYGTNSRAIHFPSFLVISWHNSKTIGEFELIESKISAHSLQCPLIEIVHLTSPETKALAEKSRHTRHQNSTIVLEHLQAFTKETSLFHGFNIL